MTAQDVVNDDRRSGGASSGVTIGRDAVVAMTRAIAEVGLTTLRQVPLTIRRDRLALYRRTWLQPDGFEMPLLGLMEFDAGSHCVASILWDAEDLPSALAELERRYLAGEGAEYEWMLGPSAEFWRCYNARDWFGVRLSIASEIEVVDHRLASAGTTIRTADQFVDYAQTMVELVPDLFAIETEYLALGARWALSRQVARGTSTEGAEVELEILIVTDMRDRVVTYSEIFPPDQPDEALARFHELEAAERAEPTDEVTTLAVRGTRWATTRTATTDEGGVVSRRIEVTELDTHGHVARAETFESDAVAAALLTMNAWYAESANKNAWIGNRMSRMHQIGTQLADAGRFDDFTDLYHSDFVREDRRHGVAAPPASGRDDFFVAVRSVYQAGFDRIVLEPLAVRGEDLSLSRMMFRADDGRFVGFLALYHGDADGRALRGVHFDEADLDEATALLDQWASEIDRC